MGAIVVAVFVGVIGWFQWEHLKGLLSFPLCIVPCFIGFIIFLACIPMLVRSGATFTDGQLERWSSLGFRFSVTQMSTAGFDTVVLSPRHTVSRNSSGRRRTSATYYQIRLTGQSGTDVIDSRSREAARAAAEAVAQFLQLPLEDYTQKQ